MYFFFALFIGFQAVFHILPSNPTLRDTNCWLVLSFSTAHLRSTSTCPTTAFQLSKNFFFLEKLLCEAKTSCISVVNVHSAKCMPGSCLIFISFHYCWFLSCSLHPCGFVPLKIPLMLFQQGLGKGTELVKEFISALFIWNLRLFRYEGYSTESSALAGGIRRI